MKRTAPSTRKLEQELPESEWKVSGGEILRTLLRDNSFARLKCYFNQEVLIETTSIIEKRAKYLIQIKKFRNEKRNLVYTDET